MFVLVFFMLNGKTAFLSSCTSQTERTVGQMSYKQKEIGGLNTSFWRNHQRLQGRISLSWVTSPLQRVLVEGILTQRRDRSKCKGHFG